MLPYSPVSSPGRVELVTLDVVLFQDGVKVLDHNEFEDHRDRLQYPQELVAQSPASTEEVRQALLDRQEPFIDAAGPWFRRVG